MKLKSNTRAGILGFQCNKHTETISLKVMNIVLFLLWFLFCLLCIHCWTIPFFFFFKEKTSSKQSNKKMSLLNKKIEKAFTCRKTTSCSSCRNMRFKMYLFTVYFNNLSNKGKTWKNQQALLIKDPEYLHLFMCISVYTDHIEYIVHVKSGRNRKLLQKALWRRNSETSHSIIENISRI